VKFARNKQILLGLIAFVAPLPLPFNEPRPEGVVGFQFLALYLLFIAVFLRNATRGSEFYLRPWMMNALGVAYLPILFLDVTVLWRGSLVRPMMHLAMFAMVAKLFSMRSERDKWHALMGIFFVFVTSMATSTHPSIVLYMVVFTTLSMLLLTRFVYLHLKEVHEAPGRLILGPRSIKRFVVLTTLVVLAVAVPVFTLMPRLNDPYISGRSNFGTDQFGTGFNERVSLDVIGNNRSSREIALRLEIDEDEIPTSDFRLKGGTYERYSGLSWEKTQSFEILSSNGGKFTLPREGDSYQVGGTMHVWLQPLRARSLIMPVEAAVVELAVPALTRDRGGALAMYHEPRSVLEYELQLATRPVLTGVDPTSGDEVDGSLDGTGISPAIATLAAEVAGDTPDVGERARRIEKHLIREYEYTLDFLRRKADSPIDDFLFKYKSGHCEYFATAMVLMLRAEGIPARFVTGFLGAEYNPLEGYYIVRQSNAHAWVEAYLPDEGWTSFDPTPPSGRPTMESPSVSLLMRQTYEHIVFLWDRSILSFGAYEQSRVINGVRERLRAMRDWVREPDLEAEGALALKPQMSPVGMALAGLAGLLALALGAWLTRPRFTATSAFSRVRRKAQRAGIDVDWSVAPVDVLRRVVERCPEALEPGTELLELYLRESFGEQRLEDTARLRARSCMRLVRQHLHRAA
jgi:transglutaminase-like putative cysteine protease